MAILSDLGGNIPLPEKGEELSMPIAQSATRTTLFPDQAVVTSTPGVLEIALLRQEWVLVRQRGKVTSIEDDTFSVEIVGTDSRPQLYDIGHVRFNIGTGIDLAIGILAHVAANNDIDNSELMARITAAMRE